MLKPPPIAGKPAPKTKEDIFEHGHSILNVMKSHHLGEREEEGNLFKRVSETYGKKNAHKLIHGAARAANERPGAYGVPEVHGKDDPLSRKAEVGDRSGFFKDSETKSRVSGSKLPPPPPIKK